MERSKQLEMAVRLLAAEIASGRIRATETQHYDQEISGRLLVLFGIVEDAGDVLGLTEKKAGGRAS